MQISSSGDRLVALSAENTGVSLISFVTQVTYMEAKGVSDDG